MRIEAAGKTWIVEQQDVGLGFAAARHRFSGVVFRNVEHEPEQLHVRWVMRPRHLTPGLARELFEYAAVRLWEDPRDGCPYRLTLEACGTPGGARLQTLRFESPDGVKRVSWAADKPLGWATDQELTVLLDEACLDDVAPRLAAG